MNANGLHKCRWGPKPHFAFDVFVELHTTLNPYRRIAVKLREGDVRYKIDLQTPWKGAN